MRTIISGRLIEIAATRTGRPVAGFLSSKDLQGVGKVDGRLSDL